MNNSVWRISKKIAFKNNVARSDTNSTLGHAKATKSSLIKREVRQTKYFGHTIADDLARKLEKLSVAEKRYWCCRGRFWSHRYLRDVFRLGRRLSERQCRQLYKWYEKAFASRRESKIDIWRILIDVTSQADRKTRSRMCQAARYAFLNQKKWRGRMTFEQFLRENGGVVGAAQKIATRRKCSRRQHQRRCWA